MRQDLKAVIKNDGDFVDVIPLYLDSHHDRLRTGAISLPAGFTCALSQ